mgnify:CR=1 FL=1
MPVSDVRAGSMVCVVIAVIAVSDVSAVSAGSAVCDISWEYSSGSSKSATMSGAAVTLL